MLHIIHQSPSYSPSLKNCLATFDQQDQLLFIENGVFCVMLGTSSAKSLEALANLQKIFVLKPHAIERGVFSRLIPCIQWIEFDGFVDLTVACERVLRW